jgi:hypothetical protein
MAFCSIIQQIFVDVESRWSAERWCWEHWSSSGWSPRCSFVQNHDSLTTNPFRRNSKCSLIEFQICKKRWSYIVHNSPMEQSFYNCNTLLTVFHWCIPKRGLAKPHFKYQLNISKSWIIMLCLELWYFCKRNYEIRVVEEILIFI